MFRGHELAQALRRTPGCQEQFALMMAATAFHLGEFKNLEKLANLSRGDFLAAPTPLGLYQIGHNVLALVRDDGTAEGDKTLRINVYVYACNEGKPGSDWVWLEGCYVIKRKADAPTVCLLHEGYDGQGPVAWPGKDDTGSAFMRNVACNLAAGLEVLFYPHVTTRLHPPPREAEGKAKGTVVPFSYHTVHIDPNPVLTRLAPDTQEPLEEITERLGVRSDGTRLLGTDYWDSVMAREGVFLLHWNGVAAHLLVPEATLPTLTLMRAGHRVIVSHGPWPRNDGAMSVELLFDNGVDDAFRLYLVSSQYGNQVPGAGQDGPFELIASTRSGRAHAWPATYRKVDQLPSVQA